VTAECSFELPPEQEKAYRKAVRLEWLTIAYLVSAIFFLFLTLGNSQAMKAAWIEDMLTLLPPTAFLIAARVRSRPPTERMPFGYHRAVSVAYLIATFAILALGAWLVIDSTLKLITAEHPSIGVMELGDWQVWQGWLMIAALLYTGIPAVIIGRIKKPLAAALHDKVLNADAQMQQADWLTAFAAIVGVLGIGLGLWWADALAAIVIGLDVTHDGWRYMGHATRDLIDARPSTYDESAPHPCKQALENELRETEWVQAAIVRMREMGHVLHAEVWVVPSDEDDLPARIEELEARLHETGWMLHDVTVMPVQSIEDVPHDMPIVGGGRGVHEVPHARRR
jgi:cation diffusion facilitator family transporter